MSTNLFQRKRIDFAVLEYLQRKKESVKSEEEVNEYEAVLSSLSKLTGLRLDNAQDRYKYGLEATLPELVEVGLDQIGVEKKRNVPLNTDDLENNPKYQRYLEVVKQKKVFENMDENSNEYKATLEKIKHAFVTKLSTPALSPAEAEKQAEAKKNEGNAKLTQQDYDGALALYTEAIELCPKGVNSHLFFANRAAAYTYLKEYMLAADDCLEAIALKPEYGKAHARLAQAYFSLNKPKEAVIAANDALRFEPGNSVAQNILDKIKSGEKPPASSSSRETTVAAPAQQQPPPGMPPGMPPGFPAGMDLGAMMNNPMVANMMKDPAMMQMAQEMMSDPAAMENMMKMMGGAGGMGKRR